MKDRIVKIMEKEGLTPGQFAEVVGIQRSAVSHLVTGRNKPSLEVTQKILKTFRSLNAEWLILGIGAMYKQEKHQSSLFDFDNNSTTSVRDEDMIPYETKSKKKNQYEDINLSEKESLKSENIPITHVPEPASINNFINKTVKKIILFYSDATFDEFNK